MQREKIKRQIEKIRELLQEIEEEIYREVPERGGGGPPQFGWSVQKAGRGKNTLVENPREQKIIARIVELREAGNTFEEVADALNREGHKTRQDGKWHIAGVQRIFVNREKRAKE